MDLISFLFILTAVMFSIPVTVFSVQCLAAQCLSDRLAQWSRLTSASAVSRLPVAVLVPAHNEASVIEATLASISPQLRDDDLLLVVADNCSDDTARLAAQYTAHVITRHDPHSRGKGFALDVGIQEIKRRKFRSIVFVDADCQVHDGTIDTLALAVQRSNRPVQASNLMHWHETPTPKQQIVEFAWWIKNWIRPMGFAKLGLPCSLLGTGMAMPTDLASSVPLAHGHLAEDVKLGLDLARRGSAPIFCPRAKVTSYFPNCEKAHQTQRSRWVLGHLNMVAQALPAFARGIVRAEAGLIAMALDLLIPPLTILFWSLLLGLMAGAGVAMLGYPGALAAFLVPFVQFVVVGFITWFRLGRDILPTRSLVLLPVFVISRVAFFRSLLRHRNGGWIRTARGT